MKNKFPGYYRPTEDDFKQLWQECTFVLDANVLLNIYRYTQPTRDELIEILEAVSDRLWVPHQAALEYHRNRLGVIHQQVDAYDELLAEFKTASQKLQDVLQKWKRHPHIDQGSLSTQFVEFFKGLEEEISQQKTAALGLFFRRPFDGSFNSLT